MTAGAVYSYFPTCDDLITTLLGDVYTSAVNTAEYARDAMAPSDPGGCLGDPVAGYEPPDDGPAIAAGLRGCTGLTGLVAAAWPTAKKHAAGKGTYAWGTSTRRWPPTCARTFPNCHRRHSR